jgi:hypothetical protein
MDKKAAGRLGGLSRAKKYAEKRKRETDMKKDQTADKQKRDAKMHFYFSENVFDKLR